MDWLRDENREDGPAGYIGFAVSARMSPALRAAIEAVPEAQWESYGKPDTEVIRQCADVLFVPNEHSERKNLQPLRYVAVRITGGQCGRPFRSVCVSCFSTPPADWYTMHAERYFVWPPACSV